jgi:DNA-directed RNA polymerase subunit L
MNPRVDNISESGDVTKFTLSGVNFSFANALRRVILSDISLVVFKTYNNEENKANILVNTTRFNNEIIKQRLGCIPIHIRDLEIPLKNYLLEVDVENLTDTIIYVTTKDFKIKNTSNDTYLKEKDLREIFPANMQTGNFIDFVRLRPKISDEIPGEKIKLTCEFSIGTQKENGMFNAVSTCSYEYTVDDVKMNVELAKMKQQWKDQGLNKDEIEFESENWKLLDGKRICMKDSFDFVVETLGIFTNQEILKKACDILIKGLMNFDTLIDTDELKINPSDNTMNNSYDIILENEDYTYGKVLEYMIYTKFFEQGIVTYCGFKKMHPHDSDSIIRVAYKDDADKTIIKGHLKACIEDAVQVYKKIKKQI